MHIRILLTALCNGFLLFFTPGWVAGVPAGQTDDGQLILTLEQALQMADERNWNVRIAREDLRLAETEIRDVKSGAYPQLSLSSNYSRMLKLPAFFLNFDGEVRKITVGSDNQYMNVLQLSQVLDLNGTIRTATRIAREYEATSEYGITHAQWFAHREVKKSFYQILLARESARVAQRTLAQAEAHAANVRKMHDQGVSSDFDLLRAEVQVANAQPAVIQAENNLELSRASLAHLLGIGLNQPLNVTGEFTHAPMDEASMTAWEAEALDQRADFRQLETQQRLYSLNVRLEQSKYLPDFKLLGNMQFTGQSNDLLLGPRERNISMNVGLGMELPIFNGLQTHARIQKARINRLRTEEQLAQLRDAILLEIKQARLRMQEAQRRIEAQARNVEQARKAESIAEIRFQNGLGTQLEVFDAQTALAIAEMQSLSAIYDYVAAQADWEYAVGR